MGIKCYCPQGHPLHVKSHQAGKRGKCPKCGVKFEIPAVDSADRSGSLPEMPELVTSERPAGSHQPSSLPPTAVGVPNNLVRPVGSPLAADSARGTGSAKPVVWYVRTREGQFGPTQEPSIAEWVATGRITAGNWLWRDGWDEWRPAEVIYPQLLASPAPATSAASPQAPNPAIPLQLDSAGGIPPGRVAARRRRIARQRKTAVVILAIISLVLVVALVYVLRDPT